MLCVIFRQNIKMQFGFSTLYPTLKHFRMNQLLYGVVVMLYNHWSWYFTPTVANSNVIENEMFDKNSLNSVIL